MARTDIEWCELHAPLFLAGTNLGQKLDPTKRQGLKLEYDEKARHLFVGYGGKTARVPETSVLSMIEGTAKVRVAAPPAPTGKPITAQVSTPQSHVFSEGPGVTGQEFRGLSMNEQEARKGEQDHD